MIKETDDLVERLRDADIGWSGDALCVDAETAAEGADEIIHLRSALERARKALEALADATFDAGLTADNTPAWIDARAALAEIAH